MTGTGSDPARHGPAILAAQDRLDSLLTAHPAGTRSVPPMLVDLPILASWLLDHLPDNEVEQYGEPVAQAWRDYQATKAARRIGRNPFASLSSAIAAAAACQALPLTTAGDDAIAQWRRLPQPYLTASLACLVYLRPLVLTDQRREEDPMAVVAEPHSMPVQQEPPD